MTDSKLLQNIEATLREYFPEEDNLLKLKDFDVIDVTPFETDGNVSRCRVLINFDSTLRGGDNLYAFRVGFYNNDLTILPELAYYGQGSVHRDENGVCLLQNTNIEFDSSFTSEMADEWLKVVEQRLFKDGTELRFAEVCE